uniref:C-type lectin domain-containing protein n=1 Tax=Leptobrachium leishanense TaxID=445787 RepID=A0A8C5WCP0_9ANUR
MVERMKQDYSTVAPALEKLDTVKGMVERMKPDSTVGQALAKLDAMKGMVERMKQDYSTEVLQKDIKKSLSALEKLSECARKETTNPLGPLCDGAWSKWTPFQMNCYKLYDEKKTWEEAKQHCEAQKAHLIVINSDAEQELMKNMTKDQYIWLGLTDADGSWKWIDGTRYDSVTHFWNVGQPDDWYDPDYKGKEDCGSAVTSGLWNDAHCARTQHFLCEKET